MHVNQVLTEAQKRLKTIGTDALLTDAARTLSTTDVELAVVCDLDGKAVGVITRADVVRWIADCRGAACRTMVAAVMTRELVSCVPDDRLTEVLGRMKHHGLRRIPVIDAQSQPIGIINARDALRALLTNVAYEAELLRDYVMGIGYQ